MNNPTYYDQYHGTGEFRSIFFDYAAFDQLLYYSMPIIDAVRDKIHNTVDNIWFSRHIPINVQI